MLLHTKYWYTLRISIPVVSLLFLSNLIFGQNIKVSGIVPDKPDELVRIITYDDQFSRVEKTLATTYCDANGNFNLDADVTNTTFAYISVGLKRGEFYLSPDASYVFSVQSEPDNQQGSIFDELPLQFTYVANDRGLSEAIGKFNIDYNTFLYENASKIYYGRNKGFISDYKNSITKQFSKIDNQYLYHYIRYSFASLEWTSRVKSNRSILEEYFIGQPVLYNNIQYTEFFTEFFKTFFIVEKVFEYSDLIYAINDGSSYHDVKKLVSRENSIATDKQLAELITTLLIAKKYYNPDIRRKHVLEHLKEINQKSIYPEISRIAGNYIEKLTYLENGTPAPVFNLPDAFGKITRLDDYKGHFVLLSFVKPDCKICLGHFHHLDEIQKQFANKVKNLTIVYGDAYREIVQYVLDRDFTWTILNLQNDVLLLEAYKIRVYPTYVIINPDGTIAMATAPMPDENLEIYLNRQIKRFEENQK